MPSRVTVGVSESPSRSDDAAPGWLRCSARRSSSFSYSIFFIITRSANEMPAASPESMSDCFTRIRTDSTPYPNRSATRLIVPCDVPDPLWR